MKICIIGAGYVGLVTGTCFAESGNDVVCVDVDKAKIKALKKGKIPNYEPGVEELVRTNRKEERLSSTTDLTGAVKRSLICFVAVGTPPGEDGSADLKHVLSVARSIGMAMDSFKVIVNKSTVPVGTGEKVLETIRGCLDERGVDVEFDVVSNPEFLKEGTAIEDFMKPDRVVVGTDNVRTAEIMRALYAPFVRTGKPILVMDIKSAEMTKYAANSMLATRISFINDMANLCESVGANIDHVKKGIATDYRIGYQFLFPGVGYGGSCFPKDVQALIKVGKEVGHDLDILEAVEKVNNCQKGVLIEKIVRHFKGLPSQSNPTPDPILKGKKIAVWGLSFKPKTDDMREAPSITIINGLLENGASLSVYDPVAIKEARKIFDGKIEYSRKNYDCLKGADALAVITEWNEFREPDFERMKTLMRSPVIFDGRNILESTKLKNMGFTYYGIGRK